MQLSLFDGNKQFKIYKPIRLIELFAGYGSQHFALEYLGVPFESWKICEWAVKSIQAYKDAHFKNDNIDYSKRLSHYEIVQYLTNKGISANYNEPMKEKQIIHLGEQKARTIYNNIMATHNLVNIQQVKGKDLDIIDTDKYCYIMTYSFPCQDLSLAGLGKGMEKGSGTRSGMLWEVERILNEIVLEGGQLPQVLVMENVPEVVGTKNVKHFAKWVQKLEELGYKNKHEILNSKDFGVPQNRERCFMVSILGDYYYDFPKTQKLKLELKDLLEENVDEKYYLSDKQQTYAFDMEDVALSSGRDISNSKVNQKIAKTISCRGATEQRADVTNFIIDGIENEVKVSELKRYLQENLKTKLCNKLVKESLVSEGDVIRHSYSNNRLNNGEKNMGRIESKEHLCPTLDTRCDCLGVVVQDDYLGTYEYTKSDKFMGNKSRLKVDAKTLGTIQTKHQEGIVDKYLRIRKLTAKECFRLMGVKDEDFENIAQNQSNASLYHLAGDSIVVDVLCAIFKQMV